jgi:hypothetical protein
MAFTLALAWGSHLAHLVSEPVTVLLWNLLNGKYTRDNGKYIMVNSGISQIAMYALAIVSYNNTANSAVKAASAIHAT